jgi:hypothetical protein
MKIQNYICLIMQIGGCYKKRITHYETLSNLSRSENGHTKEHHKRLRRLSPDFVITGYADAPQAVPHQLHNEKLLPKE